ncbi:MAG: polyprenyl synthetase family protein [Candidatus Omnitrophota bacterium]
MKYETCFKAELSAVEETLDRLLPQEKHYPGVLHEAMRYAVLSGGKRFRPVMVLAACEACGGKAQDALVAAAAVEFVHGYSLVHDDLPALDNDDLRRGKPSCHKKFGEAMAILAGDGLLTLAFQALSRVQPARKARLMAEELSTSAGTCGMIGGQVADLTTPAGARELPMLDFISIHKTGKLIKASAVCGALAAGASRDGIDAMTRYGEFVGLAFQSIDDLVDRDGYARLLKDTEIRQKVRDLVACAKREIRPFAKRAEKLQRLADFLLSRMPRGKHAEVDR